MRSNLLILPVHSASRRRITGIDFKDSGIRMAIKYTPKIHFYFFHSRMAPKKMRVNVPFKFTIDPLSRAA